MSKSEVITILVLFHFVAYKNLKHFYQYFVKEHLGPYFPQTVSYNRLVELMQSVGLEVEFLENSYGYRPTKSALSAVKKVQENVRKYSWVIDLEIKDLFGNVNHVLLLKALQKHVAEKWALIVSRI